MSDLTTASCATLSLVKCFSNSDLGVNLTTILIDMEPWFIAKEVALTLGYVNTNQAINDNVDERDQKMLSYSYCKELFANITDAETIENTDDSRGIQQIPLENSTYVNPRGMKFINESGLYDLVFASKRPEAKAFKRWVTTEVLPSIRKTGSYGLQIDKHDLLLLNISKAKTPEERALAISELEQYHTEQKKALEAENETLTHQNDTLHTELDLIRSTMFTNRRVCEMIRERFDIKYADSTLRGKVGKALKLISNELSENIIYRKDFVDGVLRSTPYYTERTMNKLIQRLEDNPAYLKSIK